jgi:Ca2+-binding EF-hand superfamily protein
MLQSKSLQDEMLKNYINTIFDRYDTDKNGTLDVHEMTFFFNDLFRTLQIGVTVNEEQSL